MPATASAYRCHRAAMATAAAEASLAGRDIGPLPPVADPQRKTRACASLKTFAETYFPHLFFLAWSAAHLIVLAKIEKAARDGGLFANAMPRGDGKTTLCETGALWAVLAGRRRFVLLIGAEAGHAAEMLQSIKVELETNDLLADDFPEVCYPIRRLEGIHQRAAGQLYRGRRTHIGWTQEELCLPTIPGSAAAGSVMRVASITGRIRGTKHKRPDGRILRPDLVLIDDPQTDDSARSPAQCDARERIINGAILGLAGPGTKIAALMTLTVVHETDLSDRFLDRARHPAWQPERSAMLAALPTDADLWAKYAEIRRRGQREETGTQAATDFYAANRENMDAGAVATWPQRYDPDELSAIQHAQNIRIDRGEPAFWAEYQNKPLPDVNTADAVTADQLAERLNALPRRVVPTWATRLTAFIDSHAKALYWMVCAWSDDFRGAVVDYGTKPDQRRAYFELSDVRHTLADEIKAGTPEGNLYGGLAAACARILRAEWSRADGSTLAVSVALADANWGDSTETVYLFCAQSGYSTRLKPSHGRGITASERPMGEWKPQPGERRGLNWRIRASQRRRQAAVIFDANYWKSFVAKRLRSSPGDAGALTIFGRDPAAHRLLFDHLIAEYPVATTARGRTCDEWKARPNRDNHWLDCLIGCAVAASIDGAVEATTEIKTNRKRVSYAAMQRAARLRGQGAT